MGAFPSRCHAKWACCCKMHSKLRAGSCSPALCNSSLCPSQAHQAANVARHRLLDSVSTRRYNDTTIALNATAQRTAGLPAGSDGGQCRGRQNQVACIAAAPAAPPPGAIPMQKLFLASALPVVKVAMLCSVGAVCAAKGFITLEGRRTLSNLIFNVFTPCLFFSKLASRLTIEDGIRLWPISANMVLGNTVGITIGCLLVWLIKPPRYLRNHLILAMAIGNTGNLPLVLCSSLGSDPALAFMGPSARLGVEYVVLGSFAASFIQFPLAYILLNTRNASGNPHPGGSSSSGSSSDSSQAAAGSSAGTSSLWDRAKPIVTGVFTPPTIALLLAAGVAAVPGMRDAVFSRQGPLYLIGEVTHMFGDMAIPALMLNLGANLTKGPGMANVPAISIISTLMGRLIVMPLLAAIWVMVPYALGWLGNIEPMALMVMMVTNATPTAILIHSMATMMHNHEDDVAALLYYGYMASVVTLPIFISLFLYLIANISPMV